MYTATSVDDAVSVFTYILVNIINKHLPLKRIRVRIKSAPWITHEFFSVLDMREYKNKQYKKCPCREHLNEKKEAQRIVQRMKNQLKRNYIQETMERYKHDSKKLLSENFGPVGRVRKQR